MCYSLINNLKNGKIVLLFYRFLALDKEQHFKNGLLKIAKSTGCFADNQKIFLDLFMGLD
ncbi:hypothetical protein RV05_GL002111 [Enterococcus hirae]|uniref:Uncharacterized protein n=1 Tax=Enterococcus hirae (strain ATCC 9790 / DSM 20160 / JCM 8729 / LMG 6399 / NBRC 3181 / NCIMB 6459 / NCDO 1258 / NCTC 12367 / WDCM 00089 / R) TaxID=768486 RepID=I6SC89_ENTHA|nr:hypothetical protein EHR_06335 [Enterococcus hirae ATCC 9790]KNB91085.1 hypothetical protein LK32_13420 [Enterococcus hirae]OWW61022.1 hypothetical protein F523_01395 [Enterococcus hirae 78-09-C1]OWW71320.1 hypothetical protein C655_00080 [Enterococcus hirae 57-09-G6]HCE19294.1 hypothetical protein [Enterococcus sp.]